MADHPPGEAPKTEQLRSESRLSPHEHALATGNVQKSPRNIIIGAPESDQYSWQHAAAAVLHGWTLHEHHEQKPILLTREDYQAALKAAAEPVTKLVDDKGRPVGAALTAEQIKELNGTKPTITDYEPHKPALSKHHPHAKDFS